MADLVLTADVSSIRDAEKALKRFSDASEKLGRSVLTTANKVQNVSSGWDQANKLYRQGIINSKALAAAQTELARELATLNGYTKANGALNTQRALAELRAAQAAREAARATEEAARAAQQAAERQRDLRMRYQEGYAAFAKARAEMRGLREAMRAGIITTDQYRERVRRLREEMNRAGQQNQGNIRSQNNLGVAIQQTGYQVGDFFVQVQSGTNFMVAFGQQATQLVGILPLIHTQLGLTAMAAIGLSTGLGIIIPIVTAVGAGFMRASGASKTLKDNFSSLDEASSVLHETFNRLADTDLDKTFGSLSGYIYSSSQAMRELAAQQELDRLVETLGKLKSQTEAGFLDNLVQGFVSIGTLGMNIKTPEMLDEEKFKELGLNMSRSTFEGFINGLRYHAQRGDRTSVVSMFQDMMSQIAESGTKLPAETFDMLVQLEKAMLRVAESQARFSGEVETASSKRVDALRDEALAMDRKITLLQAEATAEQTVAGILAERMVSKRAELDSLIQAATITQEQADAEAAAYRAAQEKTLQYEMLVKPALEFMEAVRDAKGDAEVLAGLDLSPGIVAAAQAAGILSDELADALSSAMAMAAAAKAFRETKVMNIPGEGAYLGYDTEAGAYTSRIKELQEQYRASPRKGRRTGGGGGGGKDSAQAAAEYLQKLQEEAEFKLQLIGLSEQEQRGMEIKRQYLQTLEQDNRKLTDAEQQRIDAIVKAEEALKKATEAEQRREAIQQTISSNIENALMSVVDGTQSVEDAFKSMLRNIILEIYRQQVAEPFSKAIGGFISSLFSANGNVFNNGAHVQAYANGGVVSRTTAFPMRGGIGIMGEAGPEAIMPLKRGKNGKLGVQMEGGGDINIVQNYNFQANGDESVKRIISQETPKIMEMTKAAVADARQRGGSYGRAFG